MNRHLTSDQIDGWLAGDRSPDVERHLHLCNACADELSRSTETLALFRGAVRSWSADQSKELTGQARGPRPSSPSALHWWRIGLAFAAMLVLLVVPILRHRHAVEMAKKDDLLLRQVDQEISRSVPAPMQSMAKLIPGDLSR